MAKDELSQCCTHLRVFGGGSIFLDQMVRESYCSGLKSPDFFVNTVFPYGGMEI